MEELGVSPDRMSKQNNKHTTYELDTLGIGNISHFKICIVLTLLFYSQGHSNFLHLVSNICMYMYSCSHLFVGDLRVSGLGAKITRWLILLRSGLEYMSRQWYVIMNLYKDRQS